MSIPRSDLEQRVLAGLRDRMMATEMVAGDARLRRANEPLNRERRANGEDRRSELAKIQRTANRKSMRSFRREYL